MQFKIGVQSGVAEKYKKDVGNKLKNNTLKSCRKNSRLSIKKKGSMV